MRFRNLSGETFFEPLGRRKSENVVFFCFCFFLVLFSLQSRLDEIVGIFCPSAEIQFESIERDSSAESND